ncbi:MAG: hypothetical protein QOF68_2831 [Gaiellales bacterium]|nr:hypothetical protein [Gaiellales bacterium]
MKRWVRSNSLSLFFLALFLATLAGQSQASWRAYRDEQLAHREPTGTYAEYLVSPDFSAKVMENWQSEFLQFTLYILATVWLVQRGSNESKEEGTEGRESDKDQRVGRHAQPQSPLWARVGGWRTTIYENSLVIAMTTIFFGAWFAQFVTGLAQYNQEQTEHGEPTVGWMTYIHEPHFWDNTLQNWQSEFLAVGTMAIFTVYLRQRGSPESKPVGAPHEETASSG